ncbi:10765_t:CDS:2 [Dentiscutata heterogama]|uniref:10765_t:CDS:1 n=1 Tax=Dentiscutata heterogama TaxID=1316150 RepID=A0ACA9K4R8_9GLOM|nr:10765_t:CDS:2 [Dentiscutata heterogama]
MLLTDVVWVSTETFGWWPAEIISQNKSEKPLRVQLFGDIPKKTMELDNTSGVFILPFRCDKSSEFLENGRNSDMKEIFKNAVSEAEEKETEENDGLPSEDYAFHKIVDSVDSTKPSKRRKITPEKRSTRGKRKSFGSANCHITHETSSNKQSTILGSGNADMNFQEDGSLMIPGEPPDKYKIKFCDGTTSVISRKKFFTRYEDGFQTCQLGGIELEKEDPNYYDQELIDQVHDLEDILYRVLTGSEESAWRYRDFIEGGKKRNQLAKKVSPGPFSLSEFAMIAKVLRGMFIPEVAESIDRHEKISSPKKRKGCNGGDLNGQKSIKIPDNSIFYKYSKDLKLRFVSDVLLPEVIIRLIMDDEGIDYDSADEQMLTGYDDSKWVENLMAVRISFQVESPFKDIAQGKRGPLYHYVLGLDSNNATIATIANIINNLL